MTTIAYRDGELATDSAVSGGGVLYGRMEKAFKCKSGGVVAFSGDAENFSAVKKWASNGVAEEIKLSGGAVAIYISKRGEISEHGENGHFSIDADFYAIGSGAEIAMGAMAAGASAEEAVLIACRLNPGGTAAPVVVLKIGDAE